ncbi:MAG: hypothetical protein OXH84_09145 [Gammaproteobacteria bacterium]|nr:hypothetical protein [Gammaproteobacteria bacterium]
MIEIERRQSTGHLSQVKADLVKRLRNYMQRWKYMKLGITTDPDGRASAHDSKEEWSKMVLLWETSSESKAREAERFLVERFKNSEQFENKRGGGGGAYTRDGWPCYLYVLLAN